MKEKQMTLEEVRAIPKKYTFSDLYIQSNDLCNAIDTAMVSCSTAMAGYACHGAFKGMGELQQAYKDAATAREALLNAAKILDKFDNCKEQYQKEREAENN
jgi:hypothetical protein